MNDAMKELGRRAIAAGFGLVPGSVWTDADGRLWSCMRGNGGRAAIMHPMDGGWSMPVTLSNLEGLLPAVGHPATIGCLLQSARDRWVDSGMFVRSPNHDSRSWRVFNDSDCIAVGATEAEALVCALGVAF